METATTNPIVSTYTCLATNAGVSIFQTHESPSPLSLQIKVTRDMGRAKTVAKYWVSEQDENGIYEQPTTAMFATKNKRWFFGDLENKKHLIIFQCSPHREALRTFYFKDFYPKSAKRFVNSFIK